MKKISIIGLGFIGLPLACVLAAKKKQGKFLYQVHGIDKKVDTKYQNKNKIFSDFKKDIVDKKLLSEIKFVEKNKKIILSNDLKKINKSKIVIISVSFDFSSLSVTNSFKDLKNLFYNIGLNVDEETLVILETTIPPGTSEKIIIPCLKKAFKKKGLSPNKLQYAYSYERIMPGNNYYASITDMHRNIAGNNIVSEKRCKNFFESFINTKKYKINTLKTITACEASKILENSYRAVNIALIDEWTVFSNKIGINLNQIIDRIKLRHTHKNIMRPGLGVGGYCLTKDPKFVEISNKFLFKSNVKFPLTLKAVSINNKMYENSYKFLRTYLNVRRKLNILVCGVSYKQDVGDIRFSPSIQLIKKLNRTKHKITIQDPIVYKKNKEITVINIMPNLKNFDLVIFCVAHKAYKKINFKKLPKKPIYIDLNIVFSEKNKKYLRDKKYKVKVLGDD